VLTKSFYLLRDFPGRYDGGVIWVEQGEGRIITASSASSSAPNDWAGAWAIDNAGRPLYATVPAATASGNWPSLRRQSGDVFLRTDRKLQIRPGHVPLPSWKGWAMSIGPSACSSHPAALALAGHGIGHRHRVLAFSFWRRARGSSWRLLALAAARRLWRTSACRKTATI